MPVHFKPNETISWRNNCAIEAQDLRGCALCGAGGMDVSGVRVKGLVDW